MPLDDILSTALESKKRRETQKDACISLHIFAYACFFLLDRINYDKLVK